MILYNKKKDKYYVETLTNSAECNHHHKRKDNNDKLVEFAGETFMPINPNPATNQILIPTVPRVVSSVSLNDVKEGNVVWLNGFFQVNNNDATPRALLTSIYRNVVDPTNLVYQVLTWVDSEDRDDHTQIVAQFVDHIGSSDSKVTYLLTIEKLVENAAVFFYAPITFTASEIKR